MLKVMGTFVKAEELVDMVGCGGQHNEIYLPEPAKASRRT